MRIIFPLLTRVGLRLGDETWHYPTGRDNMALHINAYAIQSFIDRILNHNPAHLVNPVAMLHQQKGLVLLRQRLNGDDDEAKVSDDTISVVLKLAGAAQFDGDDEGSKLHMQGLRKMIDIRGGVSVFEGNSKLLVEIWRYSIQDFLAIKQ